MMKRYLIKIVLFFTIIAVIDYGFGLVCDYLRDHTRGGFSGNVYYICEKSSEDIIMMGSSRMRHHYVPQVFEDSLRMSCYNAGIDGNGIILSYGFLEMILERYTPKMIVYDVTVFDMFMDDNTKYLGGLKAFYDKAGISDIFKDVDPKEPWKMISSLYRYNSDFLGLLGDNIHPIQSFEKGYWPINKVMDYEPAQPLSEDKRALDSLKLNYVDKFIHLAKENNVQLFFVVSPTYWGEYYPKEHISVKEICEKENIPFLNYYYDEELCSSKDYWGDATHLNDIGANVFSKKLCHFLIQNYNL